MTTPSFVFGCLRSFNCPKGTTGEVRLQSDTSHIKPTLFHGMLMIINVPCTIFISLPFTIDTFTTIRSSLVDHIIPIVRSLS